ncbi:hypothetical protein SAV31267_020920 [Streptomyces avermitilis]|uniref:Uncharacterized protein n=1 Tax=Streptomyces avermitilis TaxID=33903 RepID=A0A4D4MN31_STRAX|nr:hypothetical protein SAV31267_020920 [Streptomyces avermitilis]
MTLAAGLEPPLATERYRPRPPLCERPGKGRSARRQRHIGRAGPERELLPHFAVRGEQDGRVRALEDGGLGEPVEDDEAEQVAA